MLLCMDQGGIRNRSGWHTTGLIPLLKTSLPLPFLLLGNKSSKWVAYEESSHNQKSEETNIQPRTYQG